ncbi:homocysteine S-methyltransferase family protein [Marinomonas posidonica]|uniref:Homocysteine S-methyltransferase n=1 Tax=Marinomonas posidonica (strain CECT 7376 / NCIMB 14433 / IVIA-Po-181) TaxID=491952 RepID=F6D083_MARPP|nr:homocysteine S-methyltransferase family protein [Marinomonas posidonica]AEF55907.1 homocysteine S-methyltransferase [Marinomonas posidonica IVIA-Po-181]
MNNLTLLDGGIGRELKRIGAPFSQPLWSAQSLIEAPHYVTQVHENFIQAGADIITVNSYACVPFHLGETLYQQQGATLARQAAIIAKDAANNAPHPVLVAGSLPPPLGSYRPDLFEQQQALDILTTLFEAQDEHVDLWLAETIASIGEANTLVNVLKNSTKPCYYAFTLSDELGETARLRSGESVAEAIDAMLTTTNQEQAIQIKENDGIFFNCSIPEAMEQAIRDTTSQLEKHHRQLNIGVYANSFTPISQGHEANLTTQASRDLSPEEYLVFAKKWHHLGANIIGGCCGINPNHIKALAEWKHAF